MMDTGTLQLLTDRGLASDLKIYQPWNEGTSTAGSPCSAATIQTIQVDEESASEEALKQYTLEEVREHWEMKSCWIVLFDFVYDVTEFLQEHPGGSEIILEHAGYDSTLAFNGKGHSDKAHKMLQKYCIGKLVSEQMATCEGRVGYCVRLITAKCAAAA